jgi:hypothetical protein
MNQDTKKIDIIGTNNRYKIKNLINPHNAFDKEVKKRVETEKWTFSEEHYKYENQINMISRILNNNFSCDDEISKIAIQQINKKIYGYKQQDILKKLFDQTKFLTIESIITSMVECQLNCRYCRKEINVLYDISREMTQWSVDRVDNNKGHNTDNFHLACLDCNLKRRRRTDEKYLFTKQLNIIKQYN